MKIALVGNPNCGKTTLFNELTGTYQYVGNWPGVTVEKKTGKYAGDKTMEIVDLPGVYSLSPYTSEEVITRDFLSNDRPDAVINIVDGTNLERNLYLTTQVLDMGIPTIVAINLVDVLRKHGASIDINKISKELGVDVIEISALKAIGIKELMDKVSKLSSKGEPQKNFSEKIEEAIGKIQEELKKSGEPCDRYTAIKVLENDSILTQKVKVPGAVEEIRAALEKEKDDDAESIITNERYEFIQSKLQSAIMKGKLEGETTSDKIDKVLTSKLLGLPIFLAIMWLIYYVSIATIGDKGIGLMEDIFGSLGKTVGDFLEGLGASEGVVSLISDGVIGGVGAIFTFVPQMLLLFFFLAILEDSGYMARVAFIMDKVFRRFGLSGKSFIPMLVGTGCSIPGVMATRTIENDADKRMTILLTPFMPCGAKLPVFAMFIALVFNDAAWVGPFIYLFAMVMIVISGMILKRTKRFAGDPAPFILELPEYRIPSWKNVSLNMLEKAMSFIRKAGSIILICNVILWVLQNFNLSFQYIPDDIDSSMLANLGNLIRPLFIPLGFGDSWASSVASLTGFAAKEVVVSTFATIGDKITISFTQVTAMSFIIMTMFAPPCFAAIGAMRRELGSFKKLGFMLAFQLGVAYVVAALVNLIGSTVFKGTSLTEPMPISVEAIEEAEEFGEYEILPGDIVAYIFLGIIIVFLILGIFNAVRSRMRNQAKAA